MGKPIEETPTETLEQEVKVEEVNSTTE